MFSENPTYVKFEENAEDNTSVTPLVEPSVGESAPQETPVQEFKDESQELLVGTTEAIPEQTPLVERTESTIPDSTPEVVSNKCMMGCSIM